MPFGRAHVRPESSEETGHAEGKKQHPRIPPVLNSAGSTPPADALPALGDDIILFPQCLAALGQPLPAAAPAPSTLAGPAHALGLGDLPDLGMLIIGTEDAESLFGTEFDNGMYGLGGNDHIRGYGGNDFIDGGDGNDALFGGAGDDEVYGGAPHTLANRFLDEFFGPGVQHIAFEASDLFGTVEGMLKRGLAFINMPDNYYDDLAARYDLGPDTLDRLRRNDILYDRDATGEFLQVYTLRPRPACVRSICRSRSGRMKQNVSGMGGFYFGAHYPKAMAAWYEEPLGHRHLHDAVWLQEGGTTISTLSP